VRSRAIRTAAWLAMAGVVVLGARTLGYALAPNATVLTLQLEQSVGGPRLVVVVAVAVGLALAISAAVVGLAALAVRERATLEPTTADSLPQLRPLRLAARYVALFVITCASFTLLESYIHWRAGLGWHGLHCLIGPMHRDAIPLLAALSLVGVALFAAVEHLLAWARRTVARLSAPRVRARARPRRRSPRSVPLHARSLGGNVQARGPPIRSRLAVVI
jgi:hypothetical protein